MRDIDEQKIVRLILIQNTRVSVVQMGFIKVARRGQYKVTTELMSGLVKAVLMKPQRTSTYTNIHTKYER